MRVTRWFRGFVVAHTHCFFAFPPIKIPPRPLEREHAYARAKPSNPHPPMTNRLRLRRFRRARVGGGPSRTFATFRLPTGNRCDANNTSFEARATRVRLRMTVVRGATTRP